MIAGQTKTEMLALPMAGRGHAGSILAYHEVLPTASSYRYQVTDEQFRQHLAVLSSRAHALGSPVAVTFDDGHRSNFEHAFSLLAEAEVQATFFVLPQFIGNSKTISWAQAREMLAAGHWLQSHGWNHRVMPQCSPCELQEELVWSKRELEDRLGEEVTALSVPGGRWNDQVVVAAAAAGYRFLFHSNPWTRPRVIHGVVVRGRLMITDGMDARSLNALLQTSRMQRFMLQGKYSAKDSLRRMLGERFYHQLWCRLANWKPEDGLEVQVD